jgi:hypothetical protein
VEKCLSSDRKKQHVYGVVSVSIDALFWETEDENQRQEQIEYISTKKARLGYHFVATMKKMWNVITYGSCCNSTIGIMFNLHSEINTKLTLETNPESTID